MAELDNFPEQVFEPAYKAPDVFVDNGELFNIEYYKSHYVPVREVIELKRAQSNNHQKTREKG